MGKAFGSGLNESKTAALVLRFSLNVFAFPHFVLSSLHVVLSSPHVVLSYLRVVRLFRGVVLK